MRRVAGGHTQSMQTFELAGTACAGCGAPVDGREVTWVKGPDGTIRTTVLIDAPSEEEQTALAVWHLSCLATAPYDG